MATIIAVEDTLVAEVDADVADTTETAMVVAIVEAVEADTTEIGITGTETVEDTAEEVAEVTGGVTEEIIEITIIDNSGNHITGSNPQRYGCIG